MLCGTFLLFESRIRKEVRELKNPEKAGSLELLILGWSYGLLSRSELVRTMMMMMMLLMMTCVMMTCVSMTVR